MLGPTLVSVGMALAACGGTATEGNHAASQVDSGDTAAEDSNPLGAYGPPPDASDIDASDTGTGGAYGPPPDASDGAGGADDDGGGYAGVAGAYGTPP